MLQTQSVNMNIQSGRHEKARHQAGLSTGAQGRTPLTLTGLKAFVFLVDHINAATALDHATITVAAFQCFQ